MRFKLFAVFVLLLFSVSGASAWTNTGGGDHGGANWTPDGDTIAGVHTGVNIFKVSNGATTHILQGTLLEVHAVNITVLGTINGNARGYAGGLHRAQDLNGYDGSGTGHGGGGEGWASDSSAAAGGGGAGFGDTGNAGTSGTYTTGGHAGIEYSDNFTYEIYMGSGGGAGGSGYTSGSLGGDGGNGGAGLLLRADKVDVSGTINVNGEAGDAYGGIYGGGGGGGSGGGILLMGNDVTATGTFNSNGATGGAGYWGTNGGSSTGGRIKIFYTTTIDTTGITTSITGGSGAASGTYNVSQLSNAAPTVPTVISPTNASTYIETPLTLSVNSTDAEGDTITYYFYGDTVDGSVLLDTITDAEYIWSVTEYDVYYWKVRAYDGLSYSANTTVHQFTLLIPLTLLTPANDSSTAFPFPPLLNTMVFAWEETNASGYKYQIATDSNFDLIAEEDIITDNTTSVDLEVGEYFWRVYAYDVDEGLYSNTSAVWQFSITESGEEGTVTAIDGVVYEAITSGNVEVDGALVNIWNDSWSDSMLVGQNGYYYFDGAQSGTYSVRATKTGYTDSSIELVTVQALNTTTRNILLQSSSGAGQAYVDHYVKFIVKSLTGALYSDVEVNVYLGDAVTPQHTGTTGTDGSISFELNEYQEYRITFEKTSPSIDREITLYPKDDSYTVYVDIGTMIDDLLNPDDEEQAITAIDVSVTKTIINDNTANITVNYNDIMDETSGLTLTLSQSIAGNTTNKTVLSTVDLGTANNTAYNFTVTNYNGESYLIEIEAIHTTHGTIYRMYGIQFENTDTLFGFTGEVVGWLAIVFLTWFALTATSVTVPQTAIGVCTLATIMMAIGWGSYISVPGLALAWFMSIGATMAQAKEATA